MVFHSKFYHSNYLEQYYTLPTLTIEQAYVLCYNDIKLMHKAGIYCGKKYDAAVDDLKKLSDLIVKTHLFQSGFELINTNLNIRAYICGNESQGSLSY